MKGIEQIAKEFQEIVKGDVYSPDDEYWSFYYQVIGYIKGDYYHVCFRKHADEPYIIEVSNVTDCQVEVVSLIKGIEPLSVVHGHRITTESITF